jgi:hypothetical protein
MEAIALDDSSSALYPEEEETRVPRENHRSVTSHWQTLSHPIISSIPARAGFELSGDRHWLHR